MQLKERVRDFPREPGVYIIRSRGEVIYVGKSASLRDRVRSYFHSSSSTSLKTRVLRDEADDIDYIVTDSEVEALILEENLIKEYRPRYNVLLKDNKSYPYLQITEEEYPRVVVTRRRGQVDGEVFGPYTDAGAMRETLDALEKIFPIKDCGWSADDGGRRPCLRYHIGLCSAPCAGKVDRETYLEYVDGIREILKGNYREAIGVLREHMEEAAGRNDFEKAAEWRDKIQAVKKISNKQRVRLKDKLDRDFIAMDRKEDGGVIQIFFVRRGRISGQDSFEMEFPREEKDETIIASFVQKFYRNRAVIPEEIYVEKLPADVETIEAWLSDVRSGGVEIIVPRRGAKRRILEMAERNARFSFKSGATSRAGERREALLDLQSRLGLPALPERIEGYDISNISGEDAVGSMVVFTDGQEDRSAYRRFKISEVSGPDDYRMIKQVLRRRLGRVDDPGEEDESFASLPDLILIDGGKGQLNAGEEAVHDLGLDGVNLIGLAKEFEEVYQPGSSEPVSFDQESQALKMLQRVRDEAHRFALDYHRRLRQKRTVRSSLDSIRGVGPKRKAQLLNTFKSVEGVRRASLSEISAIPNMPEKVAERIYRFFADN
ncbi:excinuclease ABC subunit UvrC [Candidatus Bipolaricaulota bacterium]|nr:excinuclease ABC subunit UvrC [Candidatus Bipolaricaulota bacterium]